MFFYQKMIYYKLKKVISSKYNRKQEQRYQRAVVFVIENIATGTEAFFQIDRIHKESASLRCQTRKCGHRLVIEHKFCPKIAKTDFEAAAIVALLNVFPTITLKLCSFHLVKSFRHKLRCIYGAGFLKNKKVAKAFCFLRAVPYMRWSTNNLMDDFFELLGQTLPADHRNKKFVDYVRNTYFDCNGRFKHFCYLNFDYFYDICSGVFCTTTNSSEAINASYNRFCKTGFRSTNIVATQIRSFKKISLEKRGLIERFGDKKMNKMKLKTATRQKEITRICNSITCLTIAQEKALLPRLLTDLGNANTSQDLLDSVPADFLFLNEIFC